MSAFFSGRLHANIRSIAPTASVALTGLVFHEKTRKNRHWYSSCSAQDSSPVLSGVTPVEDANPVLPKVEKQSLQQQSNKGNDKKDGSEEKIFHGLFPERQLWKSKMPHHVLWDDNWDDLEPADDSNHRLIRKNGVTRHIILVRHGQYDETYDEDEKRILTPLGREQADKTGKRIAQIVKGIEEDERFGPCNVKSIRVSDMARAKETADIIAKHLPGIHRHEPDPLLNEGRPCHHIPCRKASDSTIRKVDKNHPRIEEAFRKYFYRAPLPITSSSGETEDVPNPQSPESSSHSKEKSDEEKDDPSKHEFEIIVCHANVIRYFFCRAIQIPPEAWLRLCIFNCSLNYFTIRPTGGLSCRMLGDIGHLGYEGSTFSMHHGFNW